LEICEQLQWQPPDKLFVAVGDGCIIGGLWKGLRDAYALGLIERMPQLIGVQAEGSSVLARAWAAGGETVQPCTATTLADSIAVGMPRDAIKALRAVRQTGGEYITVSDDEILEAMRVLAREEGVFGEPAGVTGLAGLLKMRQQGRLDPAERAVVLVTGNGLKDVQSAMRATRKPHIIEPTMEELRRLLPKLNTVAGA